ncbi:ABC transporter ATP-binding protein [Catelliglobosispora koreensis]|uniref:ABC transporter ATP-binding protein n=1 Tax=Catelliglobosispora koreensis TaxID=129052 RepID=UPI00037D5F89
MAILAGTERIALRITDLCVQYATGTLALSNVSLTLRQGEFVAVVGPSGCGKSSMLRVAAGLLAASQGSATRSTEHVGFVFQDPTLLPWRTVRGNVELSGELRGTRRAERKAKAAEAIGKVGLSDVAGQRPGTLSGGMRMRVSLARTLASQPELMLLDEPFAAVDEITRGRLCDDLQRLFVADKFAALFVTHSIAEAVFLASRVLVLSDRPGRLIGEVPVPLPYPRSPQVRFTSEFTELTAQVSTLLTDGEKPLRAKKKKARETAA